jgi:hypothetical protein
MVFNYNIKCIVANFFLLNIISKYVFKKMLVDSFIEIFFVFFNIMEKYLYSRYN